MTPTDKLLYKTRKSLLELEGELGIQCVLDSEISLTQCTSCSVWAKPTELIPDLDGLPICKDCHTFYGP